MPATPEPMPPPETIEAAVAVTLSAALGTPWGPDERPRVLEPADAQTLAAYHADVLTTLAACVRALAAEIDRLRADRSRL